MIFMEHAQKQKYYWLLIEQDLLGCWCVKKIYGSSKNKSRGIQMVVCDSQEDAWKQLCDLEYKKRQLGYIYSKVDKVEYYDLTPQIIADRLLA